MELLAIALVLIFVLHLIDKHNRWRQAVKVVIGLVVITVLGIGSVWGWQEYNESKSEKQAAAEAAAQKPFSDCISRNIEFSNATEECTKDPSVVLHPVAPTPAFVPTVIPKAKIILGCRVP